MSDDQSNPTAPKGQLRFRDRDPKKIAIAGLVVCALAVGISLDYDRIPVINGRHSATVYVADAAGLKTGDEVHVAGMKVGEVRSIAIDGTRVKIGFDVDNAVHLGADTSAQIKTDSLLGRRALAVFSDGKGSLPGNTIPEDRTSTPYALTDALGDLSNTVGDLDTKTIDQALDTLSDTMKQAGPQVSGALDGLTRLSRSLNDRDQALRDLLRKANDVSGILGQRSDQFNQLVVDGNQLFAALDARKRAINDLVGNITSLSQQLSGLVQDQEAQIGPALDKLNGVSDLLIRNRDSIDQGLRRIAPFATALGEAVASGPWFNAYISNLAQPQYWQNGVHNLMPLLNPSVGDQGPYTPTPGVLPQPNMNVTSVFPGWATTHGQTTEDGQ